MAHLMNNTDKEYPCIRCGTQGNIIREGADPRLKCNNTGCNFMYNGSDSLAAKEANAIPSESPQLEDTQPSAAATPEGVADIVQREPLSHYEATLEVQKLPRTLRYLVVSKDRFGYEFANAKQLQKVVFQWEAAGKSYEVFELSPKQITAKVDIK